MRRAAWVTVGAITITVVIAVLFIWLARDKPSVDEPTVSEAETGIVVRSIDDEGEAAHAASVAALIEGLPAQFAANDASALAVEAQAEFGDVSTALPANATLTADTSTWSRTGSVASVHAVLTAPGEPTETYLVVLVFEADGWKISSTLLVPSPTGMPS